MDNKNFEYVGFCERFGANLIDGLILIFITLPPLLCIYGTDYLFGREIKFLAGPADFLISHVFPFIGTIAFWRYKQATPGKMLACARVVDAETGKTLSIPQSIIRYLGYFLAFIPLGIDLLWVAFDPKKQGWHDKIAGTIVIRR